MIIKVRKANKLDVKDIFDWRNDELSRKMSPSNDFIEYKTHTRWFASSLSSGNNLLLICENQLNKKKICFVSFMNYGKTVISINFSPSMRGKGLAKECLEKTITYFKFNFNNVLSVNAKIAVENIVSKVIFESVGFKFEKVLDGFLYYRYQL